MRELTIIISYYKALDNLQLILKSLNRQSSMSFEVIISEDDNNQETIEYLEKVKTNFNFQIKHLNQATDDGFRKNAMLNKAITHSNAEKIAFIDGDCIPHRHFVKQYILNIDSRSFCVGRSVMLDEKTTLSIKKNQSLEELNYFALLFSKSTKIKEGLYFPLLSLTFKSKGLVGRNWGCGKTALIEINGFDEDYVQAGVGEDVDIEWRLLAHGLSRKSIKNKAIVYHLYHHRWYTADNEIYNYSLMRKKIDANHITCLNGIKTIDNSNLR